MHWYFRSAWLKVKWVLVYGESPHCCVTKLCSLSWGPFLNQTNCMDLLSVFWRFQTLRWVQISKADKGWKNSSVPQCMEIEGRPPQLLRELKGQGDQSDEHLVPAFCWQGSIQLHWVEPPFMSWKLSPL